jgi:hypothetical protein
MGRRRWAGKINKNHAKSRAANYSEYGNNENSSTIHITKTTAIITQYKKQ